MLTAPNALPVPATIDKAAIVHLTSKVPDHRVDANERNHIALHQVVA